jgi:hypothetical protein
MTGRPSLGTKAMTPTVNLLTVDKTSLKNALDRLGIAVVEERRSFNNDGWRIRTDVGPVILLLDSGIAKFSGKGSALLRTTLLAMGKH